MPTTRINHLKVRHYKMYINGEWICSKDGELSNDISPTYEKIIATVSKGNREDVKTALEAAARAQPKL
jgi:lactaldehyde dehydrogenase/glycolaldehyde dehydrogenase